MNPPVSQPRLAGAAGLLAVLASIVSAILHKRVPDEPEIGLWIAALASAWGNWQSRQWNVPSERVGCIQPYVEEPPRPPGPRPPRAPVVALVGLVALTGPGCILSHRDKGDIVGITQSVIGIDLSQSPADAVPHVRIGYVRSQIHVVPTGKGTNGVIHAPPVANSAHTEVTLGKTDITEDFTTGSAAEDDVWREGPTTARAIAATRKSTAGVTNSNNINTNKSK